MWFPFNYSLLLVGVVAGLLLLLTLFLMRNRWRSDRALQSFFDAREGEPESERFESLIPVLLLEEEFPSFGRIVGTVLDHFGLDRFLKDQEFQAALNSLQESVFQPDGRQTRIPAMCQVVRSFLEDEEVEKSLGEHLSPVVDSFLKEIGQV